MILLGLRVTMITQVGQTLRLKSHKSPFPHLQNGAKYQLTGQWDV